MFISPMLDRDRKARSGGGGHRAQTYSGAEIAQVGEDLRKLKTLHCGGAAASRKKVQWVGSS